jgi:hypothetical protein
VVLKGTKVFVSCIREPMAMRMACGLLLGGGESESKKKIHHRDTETRRRKKGDEKRDSECC